MSQVVIENYHIIRSVMMAIRLIFTAIVIVEDLVQ